MLSKGTITLFSYLFPLLSGFMMITVSCERDKREDPVINDMKAQRGYMDRYLGTFRCGLFVPPSYDHQKKYPLVIFLHGYSDTTTWDLGWYHEPVVSSDPCIVLTPKCPGEEIYGWGDSFDPQTSPMMAKTYAMIELVKHVFNLDYDRFYIYGISMGGIGTYGALQKNPGMFAAAYVECAKGNPEIAPVVAEIPFWIFHGSEDNIIDVHWARDMYQAIQGAGGTQIRYTEYHGVGHNVWDYTRNESTITPWLLAQRKGAVHGNPDGVENISVSVTDRDFIRLEWNGPADHSNADNQVWFYRIYRNGLLLQETYESSFIDSLVFTESTPVYNISAMNFFFRESSLTADISYAE